MSVYNDQWIKDTYTIAFPVVARMVHQLGGDEETAKDLFHDALIICLEKKERGVLDIHTSPVAYLAGIARLRWFQKCRENNRHVLMEDIENNLSIPDDFDKPLEKPHRQLADYLSFAGQRCMELLKAFYYERLGMEEIAERFGFKSSRSATVQKFKCIEKVRAHVKESNVYAEEFS